MKSHLKYIVKELRDYSLTLEKTSMFLDKPWALIDNDVEVQKLIFKKNKELILSKNGQVQVGKWEYFPEAKSILIDRISDKILCNEAFIDKGVMILKLDGTDNIFFVLANENIVPDLNAAKYLKTLRYKNLMIAETRLADGRILEIHRFDNNSEPEVGNTVTDEAVLVEDGKYQLESVQKYFEIKKGRILRILTESNYLTRDKVLIRIQQQNKWRIMKGDYVYKDEEPIMNDKINLNRFQFLEVSNGQVMEVRWKSSIFRGIASVFSSFVD
jgi:hypothetical protein